jgi:hypothetical protein
MGPTVHRPLLIGVRALVVLLEVHLHREKVNEKRAQKRREGERGIEGVKGKGWEMG